MPEFMPGRKVWLSVMALLEKWREVAYNEELGTEKLKQLWNAILSAAALLIFLAASAGAGIVGIYLGLLDPPILP